MNKYSDPIIPAEGDGIKYITQNGYWYAHLGETRVTIPDNVVPVRTEETFSFFGKDLPVYTMISTDISSRCPKTGATHKQVHDAAVQHYKNPSLSDEEYGEYAEWATMEAYKFASALVPVGFVVVKDSDVITQELRAVISEATRAVEAWLSATPGGIIAEISGELGNLRKSLLALGKAETQKDDTP